MKQKFGPETGGQKIGLVGGHAGVKQKFGPETGGQLIGFVGGHAGVNTGHPGVI